MRSTHSTALHSPCRTTCSSSSSQCSIIFTLPCLSSWTAGLYLYVHQSYSWHHLDLSHHSFLPLRSTTLTWSPDIHLSTWSMVLPTTHCITYTWYATTGNTLPTQTAQVAHTVTLIAHLTRSSRSRCARVYSPRKRLGNGWRGKSRAIISPKPGRWIYWVLWMEKGKKIEATRGRGQFSVDNLLGKGPWFIYCSFLFHRFPTVQLESICLAK